MNSATVENYEVVSSSSFPLALHIFLDEVPYLWREGRREDIFTMKQPHAGLWIVKGDPQGWNKLKGPMINRQRFKADSCANVEQPLDRLSAPTSGNEGVGGVA
jgi:hypothetical protein